MEEKERKQARIVFNTFCGMLEKEGWKFHKDEEGLGLDFIVRGEDLPFHIYVRIDADRELIDLQAQVTDMPEEKRAEAAQAICAINYRLANGCFDYDYTDGETTFRLANSYAGSIVGEEACHYMIECACLAIDRYNDILTLYRLGAMGLQELLEKIKD